MNPLFSVLRDAAEAAWRTLRGAAPGAELLPLLRPVPPYDQPAVLNPLTMLGTLLGLVVLSGIALGALGVLGVALLGFYLLLTEVLGISIEIRPFAF